MITKILICNLLCIKLLTAQFAPLSQFQQQPHSGFSNSFSFESFSFPQTPAFPQTPQRSFTNPGELEFSNFVDLPSQRLREPAVIRGPENLSPSCALALPSGGCISYQDVNIAFGQAAESLPFARLRTHSFGNFTNEEIGNLGTVIHETTRILAQVHTMIVMSKSSILQNILH